VHANRRAGGDRRKQTGINIRMLAGDGSRKIVRRQEDKGRILFVDQYSPVLFVTIVGILFLCAIDAILTLHLLNHGAYEANPLMAYLLNIGPKTFFIPKYAITLISTLSLFTFRDIVFRKLQITINSLLYLIAGIYSAVVGWELYLFYQII
jgi:hypothetical protein